MSANSLYKCKAKATKDFGITFRSQLEAKWAYALTEAINKGLLGSWEYVDDDWRDFVYECREHDYRINIEIKPFGPAFLDQAVDRFVWNEEINRKEDDHLFIVMGEPTAQGTEWIKCDLVVCVGFDNKSEWMFTCFDELNFSLVKEMRKVALHRWSIFRPMHRSEIRI